MDHISLLLRFGSMVAIKICSLGQKFDALVEFACSKWYELSGRKVVFSYTLENVGECFLNDDEDLASMFVMLRRYGVDCVDVSVNCKDDCTRVIGGLGGGSVFGSTQNLSTVLHYDSAVVECEQSEMSIVGASKGKRLLSSGWVKLIDDVGQVFVGGVNEFRKCLIKFSVEVGFDFVYLKNEPERVTAECRFGRVDNCPWRIHASVNKPTNYFVIRTYNKKHNCSTRFFTSNKSKFNRKVIVDLIIDDIRNMPSIRPRDIQMQVKDKFGVDISYYVAWRATDAGRDKVFGDHSSSYSKIASYFASAEQSNPDSVFDIDIDPVKNKFQRCFFAFGACIVGFRYCRPVLMVDGTFLTGKHKGVLLSAVGKDGNEGLFPLAFAVVSEETNNNWEWFLDHLKEAIGTTRDLVFVSDRSHGIILGVKKVFPGSVHGFCYKHLTGNLKEKLGGAKSNQREEILQLFADCAYAATKTEFDICFAKLKATGGVKICRWLADIPKESWSNAYFVGQRYGQMTSNGCESWNNQIRDKRVLPIVKLIDGIRLLLMNQMVDRQQTASNWNTVLCKHVDDKMNEFIETSRPWPVHKSTDYVWEVFSEPSAVVDVCQRVCSCRQWQITGLPCVHAANIIFLKLRGAYQYVDECYYTSTYLKSYSGAIFPFVQHTGAPIGDVVVPPNNKRPRGRPRRKRIQSKGERIAKRPMVCTRCRRLGNHNKKSCTMPLNEE